MYQIYVRIIMKALAVVKMLADRLGHMMQPRDVSAYAVVTRQNPAKDRIYILNKLRGSQYYYFGTLIPSTSIFY